MSNPNPNRHETGRQTTFSGKKQKINYAEGDQHIHQAAKPASDQAASNRWPLIALGAGIVVAAYLWWVLNWPEVAVGAGLAVAALVSMFNPKYAFLRMAGTIVSALAVNIGLSLRFTGVVETPWFQGDLEFNLEGISIVVSVVLGILAIVLVVLQARMLLRSKP